MSIPITGGQPGAPGNVPIASSNERADKRPAVQTQAPEQQREARRPASSEAAGPAQRSLVDDAVESLNDFVASVQRDIRFRVDDVTGEAIVQVIDRESETVVRQIPSEVALQLARRLREHQPVNLLHATG